MERIKIKKYSKPEPVAEAIQWTGHNLEDVVGFFSDIKPWGTVWHPSKGQFIYFNWFDADAEAQVLVGDYIVKDADGTITPYKKDQFEVLFELI